MDITYQKVLEYTQKGNEAPARRVEKTLEEWKDILTPEEFRVTRQQGTEARQSSEFCSLYEPGIYGCVSCSTELFDSTTKFDSYSGWPSFTVPVKSNVLSYYQDDTHSMIRIEVTCSTCDAHLGHVFPDGPEPTGLRYCINGVALEKQHI
jgi:peptide-methionine (R)-S-oxide reductase